MLAVEIVSDRVEKTADGALRDRIVDQSFENGVLSAGRRADRNPLLSPAQHQRRDNQRWVGRYGKRNGRAQIAQDKEIVKGHPRQYRVPLLFVQWNIYRPGERSSR